MSANALALQKCISVALSFFFATFQKFRSNDDNGNHPCVDISSRGLSSVMASAGYDTPAAADVIFSMGFRPLQNILAMVRGEYPVFPPDAMVIGDFR